MDQLVNFTVDAFPNRPFRGRVVQIRNTPTTQSNVVTYQTIIEVRNDSLKLKPGMTANVSVVVANRSDTLRIPNSALRARIPDSLLPASEKIASTGNKSVAGSGGGSDREQIMQLMKDAGFSPGSGAPSPEVRAKMQELAKERGIELPTGGGRGRDRDNATNAVTTKKVYKLVGPADKPQIEVVSAKLGITDGSNTELIEGLAEGDVLVTSVFVAENSESGSPTNNPFSQRRRF